MSNLKQVNDPVERMFADVRMDIIAKVGYPNVWSQDDLILIEKFYNANVFLKRLVDTLMEHVEYSIYSKLHPLIALCLQKEGYELSFDNSPNVYNSQKLLTLFEFFFKRNEFLMCYEVFERLTQTEQNKVFAKLFDSCIKSQDWDLIYLILANIDDEEKVKRYIKKCAEAKNIIYALEMIENFLDESSRFKEKEWLGNYCVKNDLVDDLDKAEAIYKAKCETIRFQAIELCRRIDSEGIK